MTNTAGLNDHSELAAMLRDSAADFCTRALQRSRLRALRGATPSFDRALWRQMAELGWTEIVVSSALGGLGLGARAASVVCRALGSVAAPEPMLETAVAAATLLAALHGTEDLRQSLASGERVFVPALGTVDGDAFAMVHGHAHGTGHLLNGTVACLPLGPDADDWLIPAMLAGQPAWFHVSPRAAGITAVPLALADGSHDATITLTGCQGELLGVGEPARQALASARSRVEIASSAYLLGLAEALFAITLDFVGTRRQFGHAIGSFQVIQHRLVDLYLQLRLTEAVISECGASVDEDTGVACATSRARHRACQAALLMAREAVQIHGAMGYTDECDVGLYLNRTLVVAARYGNAHEHAARLAKLHTPHASDSASADEAQDFAGDTTPPEADWNSLRDAAFRAIVRHWFEANYPGALRNPRARLRWQECRDWYATLHARGWAAPAWPVAHGGMGLSPNKLLIFIEERERWGVARTPDQGIIMVGPVLMQYGTPAQQAYYLPSALSGEHLWCQGYSEPNAGSDLASLSTRAIREGDEFVINGQKTWTTLAQDATHMFCLVRTDQDAKPQAGISFVLIDLASPGITIRPIRNIAGDEEFCEVFLDNVRVPVASLVGELHDGWTIAKALLGFERIFIGSPKQCQYALNRLTELGAARGLLGEPVFIDRLARFALDVADLESLYKEFADIVRRGETLGPDISVLKIWASETFSRLSEFIVEAAGEAGARVGYADFNGARIDVLSQYYNARPTTLYGGSNEIQRNILAKQVLKLPAR